MFMGWQYGVLSYGCATVLCVLFAMFTLYLFVISQTKKSEPVSTINVSAIKMLCYIIVGIIALIFGAKITVASATDIARFFSASERVIGLTIVAFGTSLPELVTCIVAAIKKHSDLVIGNIIGSNIFNILFVLGITGLIQPIPFENAFLTDSAWGIIATILLFVFVFYDKKLTKIKGLFLIVLYIIYLVCLMQ